jgi:hypothetical protein
MNLILNYPLVLSETLHCSILSTTRSAIHSHQRNHSTQVSSFRFRSIYSSSTLSTYLCLSRMTLTILPLSLKRPCRRVSKYIS